MGFHRQLLLSDADIVVTEEKKLLLEERRRRGHGLVARGARGAGLGVSKVAGVPKVPRVCPRKVWSVA